MCLLAYSDVEEDLFHRCIEVFGELGDVGRDKRCCLALDERQSRIGRPEGLLRELGEASPELHASHS